RRRVRGGPAERCRPEPGVEGVAQAVQDELEQRFLNIFDINDNIKQDINLKKIQELLHGL
ncbi:hypothetical protein KKH19_02790, partial [Patescibacteria group bacterium]|nr:hypothetical protein [Patescibacteria group bacterium]